jgi:ADP-heptose:LPS heptosyltransferase
MIEFPKVDVNFLLNTGGLGDNIAALPAIKYISEQYSHVTPYVYVPNYFLPLANNMLPSIDFRPFSKGHELFDNKLPGRQTLMKVHDTLSTHLVDFAFHSLANKQVSSEHKNYLKLNTEVIDITKFQLPKEYVIITTGYTAPIREFLPEKVNAIVKYLCDKQVPVIFMGNKNTASGGIVDNIIGEFSSEIDYSKGVDLINKTTLLEAGKIISEAKAIVGVDNGLLHLAGCSDVPIIGGFTSVDPILRNPYRNDQLGWNCYNVVPSDSCEEKFFQSRTDFLYEFDHKYSYDGKYESVKSLNVEDFIYALENVL